ncbi:helix-turn-helix transcriptional regulator [Sphingomonas cavernae]|nr:LuxR C-terminal-related transcriptional regulator [Sphingomonas cavernae]
MSAVDVVASLKFISEELVGEGALRSDLILYIDSGHSGRNSQRDAEKIPQLAATNWLVLCDSKDNDVYNTLRDLKLSASAAPLDISREDLAYLAGLASRGRRIFIDEFCEPGPSDEIREIRNLALDAEQWALLRCLSEGHSNKVIAKLHNCSEAMVKVQIRALLNRLSVSNRTQAAVMAARAGLRYEAAQDDAKPSRRPTLTAPPEIVTDPVELRPAPHLRLTSGHIAAA